MKAGSLGKGAAWYPQGKEALPPERNRIGARLCAKHQPQHIERLCGIGHVSAGRFCEVLRLVPPGATQPRSGKIFAPWR